MFVNPALLKKAGLPLTRPSSPEEFLHYAQKTTIDKHGHDATSKSFDPNNVAQWGTTTNWDSPPMFLTTLWQFGGNTLSPDGKQATLNTPQTRDALTFWHDLIFKYHVCGKPSVVNNVTNNLFFANKLAMRPDGDWIRSFFIQNPKMGRLAWFMPRFGKKDVAWESGHVLVAPSGLSGAKEDAVRRFVTFLANHELQWSETAGHVPARVSAQRDPALRTFWPQNVFAKELPEIGRIESPNVNIGQVQDAYTRPVDGYWNGTESLSQAMSSAQSAVQRAISGGGVTP
jgi:ABC-type glycerol-3-phosphate transport system substrate-binding protein